MKPYSIVINTKNKYAAGLINEAAAKAGIICIPWYIETAPKPYYIELTAKTPDEVYILDKCIIASSEKTPTRDRIKHTKQLTTYIDGDFKTIQSFKDFIREGGLNG